MGRDEGLEIVYLICVCVVWQSIARCIRTMNYKDSGVMILSRTYTPRRRGNSCPARPLPFSSPRLALAGLMLAGLAGCSEPLDFDLRGAFGNAPSTADAARNANLPARPEPDARGIISYPNYQVAVAREGDTLTSLAERIGLDAGALGRYNGIAPADVLREGEVVVLPTRVAEPEGGPIRAPEGVDIATLANDAIRRADAQGAITATPLDPADTASPPATASADAPAATGEDGRIGLEPVRHRVQRGETAYSIARLYEVSLRSLADWNGLGPDFSVREGQQLLIPLALPETAAVTPESSPRPPVTVTPPGAGSPVPTPPSANDPLPAEDTAPVAELPAVTAAPDLGGGDDAGNTAEASPDDAPMIMPVRGRIVRDYEKGRNEGIDIAAEPGTRVKAAAAGTVAAVTEDTAGLPIIVVKHEDNLLTVYSNVTDVTVAKGDEVRRGAALAAIRDGDANALHFEVREGFDSTDPMPYLK